MSPIRYQCPVLVAAPKVQLQELSFQMQLSAARMTLNQEISSAEESMIQNIFLLELGLEWQAWDLHTKKRAGTINVEQRSFQISTS